MKNGTLLRSLGAREPRTLGIVGLAIASSIGLVGCAKDADFEAFTKANKDFVAAVTEAASASPEKAREVFDAQKGQLKEKLGKLKGVRSFQVKDKTQKDFETNLMASLDDVCHLDIDAICSDYKSLLSPE